MEQGTGLRGRLPAQLCAPRKVPALLRIGRMTDTPLSEDALSDATGRLYISGGKQADANSTLGNLLRLSRKDHRALVNFVRKDDKLRCELVAWSELARIDTEPVLFSSEDSSALSRLLRYVPTFPLATLPFLIPRMAEAQ